MKEILSVENMRKSDAACIASKTPSLQLMKMAGEGIFRALPKWDGPAAVVCGSGNNAGDGFVLADLLYRAGTEVKIILAKDSFSEDGKYYFDICNAESIPFEIYSDKTDLSGYRTIADCLLGTGFSGSPRYPYNEIIEKINSSGAFVVSADINSGLNGDSGMGEVFVRSDLTVSIGSFKPGHFLNMAKDAMKRKINCDIGIDAVDAPYYLIEAEDLKSVFPERKNFSHKGDFAYIALVGGCLQYSGAIRLAAMANCAMRAGAGVTTAAVPANIAPLIAENTLECTVFPLSETGGHIAFREEEFRQLCAKYKVIALGMGLSDNEDSVKTAEYLIRSYKGILLIDADGLNALSRLPKELIRQSEAKLVLTPHLKEFSRLSGESVKAGQQAPVPSAVKLAKELGAIVLLKGPSTIVTDGAAVYIVDRGCPGMATAGSGDVLSGILSAILGYNPDNLLLATAAGAYINGRAGELAQEKNGSISMLAGDTAAAIREIIF